MDLESWSVRLKVLADATRVRLLALLEREELTVAELSAVTRLAQPRVSTHLARLKEVGLVRDRRQGRWNFYSLRPEVLDEMSAYLQERKPDENSWRSCACGAAREGECCG